MRVSKMPLAVGYIDGVPRVSRATLQHYELSVRKFIKFMGDDRELTGLFAIDFHRFHAHLRDECPQIRTATANSYRRTLRSMLNALDRQDLARPLKQLKEAPPQDKSMLEEHLRLLLAVASVRDAAMISFLAASGARRGTLSHLRKEHIRIWQGDDGRFRFAARVLTKGDKEVLCLGTHQTALAMMLWLEFQPNAEQTSYVFTTSSGLPIQPRSINSIFNKLKQRAKLPSSARVNPHALRHKFAQEKLEIHDAAIVAALMGHSSPDVTLRIYAQRSEDKIMAAFFGDTKRGGQWGG